MRKQNLKSYHNDAGYCSVGNPNSMQSCCSGKRQCSWELGGHLLLNQLATALMTRE